MYINTFNEDENPRRFSGKPHKYVPFETADTTRNVGQVEHLQAAIKDFIMLFIFAVIILLLASYLYEPASTHFFRSVKTHLITSKFLTSKGLLKTFSEIRMIDQIWDYFDGILLPTIYDNSSITRSSQSLSLKTGVNMFFENLMVGRPRIRQVRVRNDSCSIPDTFLFMFSSCFNFFSSQTEDKAPFGLRNKKLWTHYEEEEIKSNSYNGKVSNYNGGGYFLDFPKDYKSTEDYFKEMWNYTWIDQGTRAIFVDFSIYAPPPNLFCLVKLVFELPPSGGVIPTYSVVTTKLFSYENRRDHIKLGLEMAVVFFLLYFILEEINECVVLKTTYFSSIWNIPDLFIVITGVAGVITGGILIFKIMNFNAKEMPNFRDNHLSFDDIIYVLDIYKLFFGLLACAVWCKFLKFAFITRPGMFILNSYAMIKKELLALTGMLVLIVFGFALFALVLFGTHVEDFSDIGKSMFSLISLFSGGLFHYQECSDARPYSAPIFFIFYIFLVVLLFLNWFTAVIVHGMALAAKNHSQSEDKFYISDMMYNLWFRVNKMLNRRKAVEEMRRAEAVRKHKTDLEVLDALLKRNGFEWLERVLFLRRHNVDTDGFISEKKMDNMVADINGMHRHYSEVDDHLAAMEYIEKMKIRVEELEYKMAELVVKVDVLVDKTMFQERLDEEKKTK